MRSRTLLAPMFLAGLLAAACGTDGVELEESTPELFPEVDETTTTEATTTTTTLAVADRLPPLAEGSPGALVTPTGIVAPITEPTAAGWLVVTPCGSEIELTSGTPVGAQHVVIDPGHGGDEPGAVGEGGLREADLNLAVARRVADILAAEGVSVLLTRDDDVRYTLTSRAALAEAVGAQAFVSIHHNAAPDGPSETPGSEVWYQIDDPESRRLSGLVYEEVFATMSGHDADWVADTDAGVKYRLNQRGTDYYGILRESAGTPAALAELAFLSNPTEEALLATEAVQEELAQAVADGVVAFLTTDDPGTGFVEPYERVEPAGPGGGAPGCIDPPLQ